MDNEKLHDLAVAYASIKLLHYQDEFGDSCDEKELYEFAKAYKFALVHFEQNYEELD